jgi:1,2-dihydroxy-3-keto-5-methylthiopentene dioxygenase
MAVVNIPDKKTTLTKTDEIKNYLASIGIDYERWENVKNVSPDASAAEILEAYSDEIEKIKAKGGYQTADVIDIKPDTPNLEPMLEKFRPEHWHDEDEVRFIVKGCGIFHIAPENGGDVTAVKMTSGDMIRVPRGTRHWFDLDETRTVRAIRLFQDVTGWTPHYTESSREKNYD